MRPFLIVILSLGILIAKVEQTEAIELRLAYLNCITVTGDETAIGGREADEVYVLIAGKFPNGAFKGRGPDRSLWRPAPDPGRDIVEYHAGKKRDLDWWIWGVTPIPVGHAAELTLIFLEQDNCTICDQDTQAALTKVIEATSTDDEGDPAGPTDDFLTTILKIIAKLALGAVSDPHDVLGVVSVAFYQKSAGGAAGVEVKWEARNGATVLEEGREGVEVQLTGSGADYRAYLKLIW